MINKEEYLRDLVSFEHSYSQKPNTLKYCIIKEKTEELFDSEYLNKESKKNTRYYHQCLIEIQELRIFLIKPKSNTCIDDNNLINVSYNEIKMIKEFVDIFNKYCENIWNLYSTFIMNNYPHMSEALLRAHRIMTEIYGDQIIYLFQEYYLSCELINWLINFLYENINESYMFYFVEICIYIKNKVPSLINYLYFKTGVFKPDLIRVLFDGRINLENISKHLDIMWIPNIKSVFSISDQKNKMYILIIPPFPYIIRSTYENGQISDPLSIDRFINFRRIFSYVGRVIYFRTDLFPITQNDDIDTIGYWSEILCTSISTKLNNLKSRNPSCSIIIIGFSVSASIAFRLSLNFPKLIQCLVLVNFPTYHINNNSSHVKKVLDDTQISSTECPILFVSGSESVYSIKADIENFRSKLISPNSFTHVNFCDDLLLMNDNIKTALNLPQDIIDCKICENIINFIKYHYNGEHVDNNDITPDLVPLSIPNKNELVQNINDTIYAMNFNISRRV